MKLSSRNAEQLPTNLRAGVRFSCGLLLLFIVTACNSQQPEAATPEIKDVGRSHTQLTLNEAVLEQSNQGGNLVWKIKAQRTTYSEDRAIGYLEDVAANLIQEGKVILKLKSAEGEIREQGNLVLLSKDIVVSDARNETVLRANSATWQPQQNLLTVSDNLRINRSNLDLTADKAVYSTDSESLELVGSVVANHVEPNLVLNSDRLSWIIPQQQIVANNPVKIVRYSGDKITDRLLANQITVDLQQHIAIIDKDVELTSLEPALKIASRTATWNYKLRTIDSSEPIRAVNSQLTVTGNQGKADLEGEIVTLSGGVEGTSSDKAKLYAESAVWTIAEEIIQAQDNVIYNKAQPRVDLTGDRATIDLKSNKAIVKSDRPTSKPVVSVVGQ